MYKRDNDPHTFRSIVCRSVPKMPPTLLASPCESSSLVERITKSHIANNCEFQANTATRTSLRAYWDVATQAVAASSSQKQLLSLWFDRLWAMHATDPQRHYHTAVHLLEMLVYLEAVAPVLHHTKVRDTEEPAPVKLLPNDVTAILFAVFFHDAVYDGKSSTNEEDSAHLFQEFATEVVLDADMTSEVVTMILASKSHAVDVKSSSFACCLFLDLDMAVLGKGAHAYRNYAGLIRLEYAFVPHDVYCEKRATVLEGFVRQQIFSTDVFRDALENRAIANLNAEVDSLRSGVIPGMQARLAP